MTGDTLKVLVTGASGFIARGCLPRLVRLGYEVHAVTSRTVNGAGAVQWHSADLLDTAQIGPLIARIRPRCLLHAAWIATPGKFWTSEENLRWLASTVELAGRFYANGGERAVGMGTCAEYAWVEDDCSEERTPLRPSTIYGQCKAAACLAFEAAAGIGAASWAWARLFFPYGPGETPERLIPAVALSLLRGEPIDCSHGRQVRDFVFVDDVAEALVALLQSTAQGTFNVGSGVGLSLREVVAVITARLGGSNLVRFGAREAPAGDPVRVVADVARMRREVGWQAAHSIDAGIDRTITELRATLAQR